jgi:hypothetical protein
MKTVLAFLTNGPCNELPLEDSLEPVLIFLLELLLLLFLLLNLAYYMMNSG